MSNNYNKIKSLAKDTSLFAISTFGSKILVFLLTPLYTAILTTKEYGIADLITSLVSLIYPILTLAIAEATLRFSLDNGEDKNKVFVNSIWFVVVSSSILLLLMPLSKVLYEELSNYWLVFVGIYFLCNIHLVFSNFIKGLGKTKLFAIQGIIQTVSIIASNVLFLLVFKIGLSGYLISIGLGYIVPCIVIFIFGKLYKYIFPIKINFKLLKQMLCYSLPMIPTLVAWAVNTNIDKFMIIGFCGLGESGIYSVAHKIPSLMVAVLSVFEQAWQLSAIKNYGDGDESNYYTDIYKALNLVCIIGCFIIILFTKFLSGILFAKDYYIAWQYVPFLAIASLFSSNSGFVSATFKAAKKTMSLFYSVIIGSIVNIILNYFLIKYIGTIGAAISTMVGFFAIWLFRIIMVQKIVKIKIDILKTIITYSLIIASAVILYCNIIYCYVIIVGLGIIVLLINIKDLIKTISLIKNLLKKFIKRSN